MDNIASKSWICLFLISLFAAMTGCGIDDLVKQSLVMEVLSVDLKTSTNADTEATQLDITVTGNVSSGGWSNARLVPHRSESKSADGVLEFDFVATPPGSDQAVTDVITPVDATLTLKRIPANLTGIRVFAETNQMLANYDGGIPQPTPQPILEVTAVTLAPFNSGVEISAKGNVSSAGWSNPTLVPMETLVAPSDGIYDYTFYATPPAAAAAADVITPIDVKQRLELLPDGFKGVRVHSASNEIIALYKVPAAKAEPIYEITKLDVSVLKSAKSTQLIINVGGNYSSSGWSGDYLQPYAYLVPPQDGIYDFTYFATPPSTPGLAVLTPTSLTHILDPMPSDLVGVRIHSASNSMEQLITVTPPNSSLVNTVETVQLIQSGSLPPQLTVSASGTVVTTGWTNAKLEPYVYIQAPPDGIYDFSFTATPPPSTGVVADVITPIKAEYVYPTIPDGLKGVRIHAANNIIEELLNPPTAVSEAIMSVDKVKLFAAIDPASKGWSIYAQGLVNSGGWSNPMLTPYVYIIAPLDGIYDFTFVATPPSGPSAGAIGPIEVTHFLGALTPDIKGYRIHGKNNVVEYVFTPDTTISPCDYVSGHSFESAQRLLGGPTPFPSPGIFWVLNFNADGSFNHFYTDVGESGKYFCDNSGFHMVDSLGNDYHGVKASVDVANERVVLPDGVSDIYYYRIATPTAGGGIALTTQ